MRGGVTDEINIFGQPTPEIKANLRPDDIECVHIKNNFLSALT